jgi:hypothetical protein
VTAPDLPTACPVCGAYSLVPDRETSALLAVCDVLVIKALEKMGNYIIRASRERYRVMGTRPVHTAHTLWRATDDMATKALRGAWDVVPVLLDVHGCCCDVTAVQVTLMLDDYVHDLAITGQPHFLPELEYRFTSRLGLPVYDRRDRLTEALILSAQTPLKDTNRDWSVIT